jgi:hypothetical protein
LIEYLQSVILGVLSSLVASLVFLYFISRLRPKLIISPFISFNDDEKGKFFVLKLINKTPRPIINIRCRLNLVIPKSVPGGLIFSNINLKLEREEVFLIDKFDKQDKDANYAWRFVCREDIESEWEEKHGSYLIFRVIATDSLSGLSKYYSQRFFTKRDCLRKGSHRFGNNLNVE